MCEWFNVLKCQCEHSTGFSRFVIEISFVKMPYCADH